MKSFIALAVLSLVASLSYAAPAPQCGEPVTVTTTVTVSGPTSTTTSATPFVTPTGPPFTPPLPLQSFQLPVTLPNNVVALGAYLQMSVSKDTPDTPIIETKQIGPDGFFAFEFNSTHEGKMCRFHFSFSAGDGSNDEGSQEIYALKSGVVDENLTFNNKPVSEDAPVAVFLPLNPSTGRRLFLGDSSNGDFLLFTQSKFDFNCPTTLTGWETRGAAVNGSVARSSANWSWNHGLIVEVLGDKPWDEGLQW